MVYAVKKLEDRYDVLKIYNAVFAKKILHLLEQDGFDFIFRCVAYRATATIEILDTSPSIQLISIEKYLSNVIGFKFDKLFYTHGEKEYLTLSDFGASFVELATAIENISNAYSDHAIIGNDVLLDRFEEILKPKLFEMCSQAQTSITELYLILQNIMNDNWCQFVFDQILLPRHLGVSEESLSVVYKSIRKFQLNAIFLKKAISKIKLTNDVIKEIRETDNSRSLFKYMFQNKNTPLPHAVDYFAATIKGRSTIPKKIIEEIHLKCERRKQ